MSLNMSAENPYLNELKKGERYEIYTKVKEIPVKATLRLSWIDETSELIGFNWGNSSSKNAFLPGNIAYVKLPNGEFIEAKIVSNRSELVLEPIRKHKELGFLKRKSIRVEVSPENPVKVKFKTGDKTYETKAKDISEYGLGLIFKEDNKEDKEFLEFLGKNRDKWINLELELPGYGSISAKGRLRRKELLGEKGMLHLGFELEFPEKARAKVRKYILERQREIVKSLKLL